MKKTVLFSIGVLSVLFVSCRQNDNILSKYIRPLISGQEFLNGEKKWCIWLENFNPSEVSKSKELVNRINNVKELRSKSTREATKKLALFPYLFYPFDFTSMQPVDGTRHRLLR